MLVESIVAQAGHHKQHLGDTAEVALHTVVEEVLEVHHSPEQAGSSGLVGIAEGGLHRVVEALEKRHNQQPQLDTVGEGDIAGTGSVEYTAPEVGKDSEEGIGLGWGTGRAVDKRDPHMEVGLRMEVDRTLSTFASEI
jgi:hypothetical protein